MDKSSCKGSPILNIMQNRTIPQSKKLNMDLITFNKNGLLVLNEIMVNCIMGVLVLFLLWDGESHGLNEALAGLFTAKFKVVVN